MKALWLVAVAVMLSGWALIGEGSNLTLYTDEVEFQRRYMLIEPSDPDSRKAYRVLRQEFLTDRITYHDYGAIVILIGLFLPWLPGSGRFVRRLARKRWAPLWWGALAVTATVGAEIASLVLDASRGEFPWFADAIIIPIFGMPLVWVLLMVWVSCNLFWRQHAWNNPETRIYRWLRSWLLLLAIFSVIVLLLTLARAEFLSFIPGLLWVEFYLLLRESLYASGPARDKGREFPPL